MRNEQGEMLPNAHLIGMFRRIVKLLFWRVRPVFVFDGAAPQLKAQTVSRRRATERQSASNATRAAQKLLAVRLVLEQTSKQQQKSTNNDNNKNNSNNNTDENSTTNNSKLDDESTKLTSRHRTEPKTNDVSTTNSSVNANAIDNNVITIAESENSEEDDDYLYEFDDDYDDDDAKYDAAEAQELLGAYRQLTSPQKVFQVDEEVLASLNERVQLDFLLGLRQLHRSSNHRRVKQLIRNDSESSVVSSMNFPPRCFNDMWRPPDIRAM